MSSHSSHHSQEVLLAQFSLYVHKSGLKPDSFHLFRFPVVSAEKYYHELVNVGRPESGLVRLALSIMSRNELHNANSGAGEL